MTKKAYFYIDDVIWLFRDLARERPTSIYDNKFMKMLKEAHDKYGMKVQLNIFSREVYHRIEDLMHPYGSAFSARYSLS